jgi:hypothetical protein
MKKMAGIVFLVVGLSSAGFAQEGSSATSEQAANHRYAPYDMLLGFAGGGGFNMSGNITELKEGYIVANGYMGVNYDFYFLNWLSASSGLYVLEHISLVLKEDIPIGSDLTLTELIQSPICITIPLAAHVNVPSLERLYLGVGANFNIPLFNLLKTSPEAKNLGLPDTKGSFFVSLPIDIGIDMARGTGSRRFVFRVTPNFLKSDTLVNFGIMYQSNIRIYRKN